MENNQNTPLTPDDAGIVARERRIHARNVEALAGQLRAANEELASRAETIADLRSQLEVACKARETRELQVAALEAEIARQDRHVESLRVERDMLKTERDAAVSNCGLLAAEKENLKFLHRQETMGGVSALAGLPEGRGERELRWKLEDTERRLIGKDRQLAELTKRLESLEDQEVENATASPRKGFLAETDRRLTAIEDALKELGLL